MNFLKNNDEPVIVDSVNERTQLLRSLAKDYIDSNKTVWLVTKQVADHTNEVLQVRNEHKLATKYEIRKIMKTDLDLRWK